MQKNTIFFFFLKINLDYLKKKKKKSLHFLWTSLNMNLFTESLLFGSFRPP